MFRRRRRTQPAPPAFEVRGDWRDWEPYPEGGEGAEARGFVLTHGEGRPVARDDPRIAGVGAVITRVIGIQKRHDALQADAFAAGEQVALHRAARDAVEVRDAKGKIVVGLLPDDVAPKVARALRRGLRRDAVVLWEWRDGDAYRRGIELMIAPGIAAKLLRR